MTTSTPATNTTSELLSLRAAALRLNISIRGVYRLMAAGHLPHPVKVGGASKLFDSDIRDYLAAIKAKRG